MYHFDPSFNRGQPDIFAARPLGLNPDGQWIMEAKDLPIFSIPKQVDVTPERIRIDGWVFPLCHLTKSFLEWLRLSFLRWIEEDKSIQNREWVDGIVQAFQDSLSGEL